MKKNQPQEERMRLIEELREKISSNQKAYDKTVFYIDTVKDIVFKFDLKERRDG